MKIKDLSLQIGTSLPERIECVIRNFPDDEVYSLSEVAKKVGSPTSSVLRLFKEKPQFTPYVWRSAGTNKLFIGNTTAIKLLKKRIGK